MNIRYPIYEGVYRILTEKDTGQAGRSSGKETDGKAEKGSQHEADRVAVLRHQEASRGSRGAHQ